DTVIHDRSIRDPSVTVVDADGTSELHAGPHLLMLITPRDAAAIGAARSSVAQQYAGILERAIRQERLRYAPGALLRAGIVGAFATGLFVLVFWGIVRVTGWLQRGIAKRLAARAEALGMIDPEGLSAVHLARGLSVTLWVLRAMLILVALDFYLTFVLGLFPW